MLCNNSYIYNLFSVHIDYLTDVSSNDDYYVIYFFAQGKFNIDTRTTPININIIPQ